MYDFVDLTFNEQICHFMVFGIKINNSRPLKNTSSTERYLGKNT